MSTATKNRLELTSPVDQRDSESTCKYTLPSLLDDWDVDFSLVFDPKHDVAKYISTPAVVYLGALHVDTFDAIIPSSGTDESPGIGGLTAGALPCLCEIWLCSAKWTADVGTALASKLLYSLLFETVVPQTRARVGTIMLNSHTARFSVAGADRASGAVTAMCVFERDHLALRIQSAADWRIFAAVVYSLAKRLCLLLGDAQPTGLTGDVEQSLSAMLEKYASVIAAASQQHAQPKAPDLIDFALVQGDWPAALFG